MPRDKSATHEKLVQNMKEEFLKYGYMKASLTDIAKKTGITAAAIYRHFPNKEAMFQAVVEPVTSEFLKMCDDSMEETYMRLDEKHFLENFNEFRNKKNVEMIDYIYDHHDVFKLLLSCSDGTEYDSFQEKLIAIEVQDILEMFKILDQRHIPHKKVTDEELHILSTTVVTALCEPVRHGYSKEKALHHADFVGRMLYPGMRDVLGF